MFLFFINIYNVMTFSYVLHLAEVPLFAKTLNRIDLQSSIMKPINQLHNSMHFLVLFNLNFWGCFSMQNFAVSCHHKISIPILCFIFVNTWLYNHQFQNCKTCSYYDIKMQTFSPPCKKKTCCIDYCIYLHILSWQCKHWGPWRCGRIP